jgi:hypothetical protein
MPGVMHCPLDATARTPNVYAFTGELFTGPWDIVLEHGNIPVDPRVKLDAEPRR